MARIELNLPSQFIFETILEVRTSDVNYAGHLANESVLTLAQEASLRFLKQHGFSEFDIFGLGLIQADTVIIYLAQAFHGDRLKVEIALDDFSNASFDFFYRISNVDSGKEVARVKTRMVFFDYKSGKSCAIPDGFREKFKV